jgi:hypothetical protein
MFADLSSIYDTEMLVTGVFHKTKPEGYGHDGRYGAMFRIKSVQKIGPTKTIKVPGFGGALSEEPHSVIWRTVRERRDHPGEVPR